MADPTATDLEVMQRQLGRELRGVVEIAHRCRCGAPDVVKTLPRLPDGTPFPTTYYLTCPRLSGVLGGLEATGYMRELEARLALEPELAVGYANAHQSYLADRAELGEVAEIAGISAGGMPDRVKCLHAVVAHALAKGEGVNPVGDIVLAEIGQWAGDCMEEGR